MGGGKSRKQDSVTLRKNRRKGATVAIVLSTADSGYIEPICIKLLHVHIEKSRHPFRNHIQKTIFYILNDRYIELFCDPPWSLIYPGSTVFSSIHPSSVRSPRQNWYPRYQDKGVFVTKLVISLHGSSKNLRQ